MNDEVWSELTFEFVKSKRESNSLVVIHEALLNELNTEIADLAYIRTGSSTDTDIMTKTIAAVRDVEAFTHVCKNPPERLQDLKAALGSCAIEADSAVRRAKDQPEAYVGDPKEASGNDVSIQDQVF